MAGDVLVFVEQREGSIKKASFEALTVGREVAAARGGSMSAMLVGSGVAALAGEAARFGAAKVFVCDGAKLAAYSGDAWAKAAKVCAQESGATLLLFAHTAMGKDLAPRVATHLGCGLVSDATSVHATGDDVTPRSPSSPARPTKSSSAAA